MRSENKVRELTTICLPWQQWTETSVWFDDIGISAFHSRVVVVDLWQSLTVWRLLLSECVAVCRRKNVGINIKFLVKLGKSGSKIREMLVQVYKDNAVKKTTVYTWVTRFTDGRDSVTDKEKPGWPATSRTKENIMGENRQPTARSIAEQANISRETARKIFTEDLDMRKVCAKMVLKDLLTHHCL
jgi:hypothetical protein